MADDDTPAEKTSAGSEHTPPAGAQTRAEWTSAGTSIPYTAAADWTVLRRRDTPTAEIFSVSYVADGDGGRPVTFVFNGGPGASSAYLHMGAIGPSRVAFAADGTTPRLPPRIVSNDESWLAFSDLVFVDPVGTGFSRAITDDDQKAGKRDKDDEDPGREFFGYKRDLESLSEFMSRWLSANGRWGSAVFIAGESYGGYRVGRLVRLLQEQTGIGLSGAVLISPALELSSLIPTDYDVVGWIDQLPTMALAAVQHGRSRAFGATAPDAEVIAAAETFATGDYASLLTRGASLPAGDRDAILTRLADLVGLPVDLVARSGGRVAITTFQRELLRDERRVLGLYDTTISAPDPFPDRDDYEGPDPTLSGIGAVYTTAINHQLRSEIGVSTDREYVLLSLEVNNAWRNDAPEHFFRPPVGATDDFRYGMALNPHMRAFITHGRYDLATPFYASDRLRNLMRLEPGVAERLSVRHFDGGHMFYAWESSRREFSAAIARFYADAL